MDSFNWYCVMFVKFNEKNMKIFYMLQFVLIGLFIVNIEKFWNVGIEILQLIGISGMFGLYFCYFVFGGIVINVMNNGVCCFDGM